MSEFKWRQFEGEIILWAVRWYCRYGISYRDPEQMMGERGVGVDLPLGSEVGYFCPSPRKGLIGLTEAVLVRFGHGPSPKVFILIVSCEGIDVDHG